MPAHVSANGYYQQGLMSRCPEKSFVYKEAGRTAEGRTERNDSGPRTGDEDGGGGREKKVAGRVGEARGRNEAGLMERKRI